MLTFEVIPMLTSELIPHSDANMRSNPIQTSEFIPMLPSELIHPSDANIGSNPIPTSEFILMLTLELIAMPDILVRHRSSFRLSIIPILPSEFFPIVHHSDAAIGVDSDTDIRVDS